MTAYIVSIVLCLLGLWLVGMYRLWKKETGTERQLSEEVVLVTPYVSRGARYGRRLWYKIRRTGLIVRDILMLFFLKAFFNLFPKAKAAFSTKDELTGLSDGPSSYFLMSISEYKKELSKKRPGRKKKIV